MQEVINSSKVKVPGFWGEGIMPEGNICGCFEPFTGLSMGTWN